MMLWVARASRAACADGADWAGWAPGAAWAPGAGWAAAGPPSAGAAAPPSGAAAPPSGAAACWDPGLELDGPACEHPASRRAAPDTSPAQHSAVTRSGPRAERALGVVFRPLGRARRRARFRGAGNVRVTGQSPRT